MLDQKVYGDRRDRSNGVATRLGGRPRGRGPPTDEPTDTWTTPRSGDRLEGPAPAGVLPGLLAGRRGQGFSKTCPLGRTVRTEDDAFRTTFSATLPRSMWRRPVQPWVAMRMRSAGISRAALTISTNGTPTIAAASKTVSPGNSRAISPRRSR